MSIDILLVNSNSKVFAVRTKERCKSISAVEISTWGESTLSFNPDPNKQAQEVTFSCKIIKKNISPPTKL